MSILWIGLLSFVMVDFASRAGCVMGVPGLFMGLVFIAAGTSVPDALSSVNVAKCGLGDMAVANVLGSNIFNIFLGLGLPWMVKSLVDGEPFKLSKDEPIINSTLILFLYIFYFMAIIIKNKWALTKNVGYSFLVGHLIFVIWNLLTQLDPPLLKIPQF